MLATIIVAILAAVALVPPIRRAVFSNPLLSVYRRILPDMSSKVVFRGTATGDAVASRGLLVPSAAVQSVEGRDAVFVVQNGRAERRAIKVSATREDEAVIASGLTAGERVVAEGLEGLRDGSPVKEIKP